MKLTTEKLFVSRLPMIVIFFFTFGADLRDDLDVGLSVTRTYADERAVATAIAELHIDLDIDSDNNDGLLLPGRSVWEEKIESDDFSFGKLVMVDADAFTPVLFEIQRTATPAIPAGNVSLAGASISFSVQSLENSVRIWCGSKSAMNAKTRVKLGERISLHDIGFDATTGVARLWMEAIDAAPGIDTKEEIDQNGRPNVSLEVSLFESTGKLIATDAVNFLPVNPGSFFDHFIRPERRCMRNAIAATLIAGGPKMPSSNTAVAPKQSITYGLKLVSEAELEKLVEHSALNDGSRAYVRDVLFYRLPSFPSESLRGIRGLRVGLYQDWNTGEYTLAFQDRLDDNCCEQFRELEARHFSRNAAQCIEWRVNSAKLGAYLGLPRFAVDLLGLQFAGIGAGGELAVSGSVASGKPATVFNTSTIPRAMLALVHTTTEPGSDVRTEFIPGMISRLKDVNSLVDCYDYIASPFQITCNSAMVAVD